MAEALEKWDDEHKTNSITAISHVLKLNGYGDDKKKMNEKNQCFKGWETLVSNIFVKGYNFCLPKPMLDSFLRNNKGKIAFHLSDEIVHLNRFFVQ